MNFDGMSMDALFEDVERELEAANEKRRTRVLSIYRPREVFPRVEDEDEAGTPGVSPMTSEGSGMGESTSLDSLSSLVRLCSRYVTEIRRGTELMLPRRNPTLSPLWRPRPLSPPTIARPRRLCRA